MGFCICGVFAISHRREERIAIRLSRRADTTGYYEAPPTPHGGGSQHTLSGRSRGASDASLGGLVADRDGSGGSGGGGGGGGLGGGSGYVGLGGAGGLPRRSSAGEFSRGVSCMSEACSVASVASMASMEESVFTALGGGALSSGLSAYRMARYSASAEYMQGSPSPGAGSSSALLRADLGAESVRRFMAGGHGCMGSHHEAATQEALLPRCSEEGGSSTGQRPTAETGDGEDY